MPSPGKLRTNSARTIMPTSSPRNPRCSLNPGSNNHIPPLKALFIYVTSHCNLRCGHCWIAPPEQATAEPSVPRLQYAALISAIRQAKSLGLQLVKLTGGEPFLYPDMGRLLKFLGAQKLDILIETNGTLVRAVEARAVRDARVRQVSVSLDGPTAAVHEHLRNVPGSFARAREGMRLLKHYNPGMPVEIIFSLWHGNKNVIQKMVSFARREGAARLKINIVEGSSRRGNILHQNNQLLGVGEILSARDRLARFLNRLPAAKQLPVMFDIPPAFTPLKSLFVQQGSVVCGIKSQMGIISDGTVSVCGIATTTPSLAAGNIARDTMASIWLNDPLFKRLRNDLPAKLEGVCARCVMKGFCLGKCRAAAFYQTGSLFAPFSFCQQAYELGLFPASRLIPARLDK